MKASEASKRSGRNAREKYLRNRKSAVAKATANSAWAKENFKEYMGYAQKRIGEAVSKGLSCAHVFYFSSIMGEREYNERYEILGRKIAQALMEDGYSVEVETWRPSDECKEDVLVAYWDKK